MPTDPRAGAQQPACRAWQGGAAAMLALALAACGEPEPTPVEVRPVAAMTVQTGQREAELTYPGELRSGYESALSFQVAGRIVERAVSTGDTVKRGQLLYRVDALDYQRNLDSSTAQRQAAASAAQTQNANLARNRALLAEGFISQAEFDQQRASTDQARSQVQVADAQRATAATQLGRTTLTAPRGGVITQTTGEVGQVVSAGQSVLTLADPSRPEVSIAVAEGDIATLSRTQEIYVTMWSRPDKRYAARVRSVAGAADPATRTFAVRLAVSAPPGELRFGETAQVHVTRDVPATDALTVPLTAVRGEGKGAMVWVIDRASMTARKRPVRIVSASGNQLLVRGLKPGETIVTAGVHLLRDGEKVRIAEVPKA